MRTEVMVQEIWYTDKNRKDKRSKMSISLSLDDNKEISNDSEEELPTVRVKDNKETTNNQ
jgi:hypothetical protein